MVSTSPVLVVGAGLAGLAAARDLRSRGHGVVVVEQGRTPGGRLATRRLGRSVLDHGAQFFTVRGPDLREQTDDWLARGIVAEWARGFGPTPDGFPRYIARGGMVALARDLATGLDVRTGRAVEAVVPTPDGYLVTFQGGSADPLEVAALIVTPPVPHSLELLAAGGVGIDRDLGDRLATIGYHRVLALLVRLDRDPPLPPPGAVQQPDDPTFTFIADNRAKGISPEPAVTFHVSHALSAELWDRPERQLRRHLVTAAGPWLGEARPVEVQIKRWRHAGPVEPWPERAVVVAERTGPVVLAGDAFGGPKVEGAYNSGRSAAALVHARLEAGAPSGG